MDACCCHYHGQLPDGLASTLMLAILQESTFILVDSDRFVWRKPLARARRFTLHLRRLKEVHAVYCRKGMSHHVDKRTRVQPDCAGAA